MNTRSAIAGLFAAASLLLLACGSTPSRQDPVPEPIVAAAPPAEIRVVEPALEPPADPAPVDVPTTPDAEWRDAFPHVRVNAAGNAVRFDGVVPIDAHDRRAPWVFLEVVVCSPDTKEHEALVMTEAIPSHVHAALLLVGLEPGSPGDWTVDNDQLRATPPRGDELRVTLTFHDDHGVEHSVRPEDMVVNAHTGARFGAARAGKWVFAGSRIISREGERLYDADGAGTLVGLTTFGSETVAWSEVISPEAGVEEPVWIADAKTTPPVGTRITVTIEAVKQHQVPKE